MKTVLTIAAKILGGIFALLVFGLMISLTFSALGRIFPESLINQLMGVALFDIGAAVSLLSFVYVSKGGAQRAISLILFVVSLAGTLGMVSLEVLLSNGSLTAEAAARPLAYAFIGMTAVHLVGVYAHHISAPDTLLEINLQSEEDETIEQAISDTQQIMAQNRRSMASIISKRQQASIYRRLSLLPPPEVIDAEVSDTPAAKPAPAGLPAWFGALPGLFQHTGGKKEATAATPAPFDSPSPAPVHGAGGDLKPSQTVPGTAPTNTDSAPTVRENNA